MRNTPNLPGTDTIEEDFDEVRDEIDTDYRESQMEHLYDTIKQIEMLMVQGASDEELEHELRTTISAMVNLQQSELDDEKLEPVVDIIVDAAREDETIRDALLDQYDSWATGVLPQVGFPHPSDL